MNLDIKFIIAGSVIILILIPLYIYRKRVFHFIYKGSDFKKFLINLRLFLQSNYPKIPFNFDIIKKTEEEKRVQIRQMLVLENMVAQFSSYEFDPQTQNCISKDLLWSNYEQNSKPQKEKFPSDWARRKECTWNRDNQQCKRCGTKIKLVDSHIAFVKSIKNGGGYNFENIFTVCNDCNKILNSSDISKTSKDLIIQERLIKETLA